MRAPPARVPTSPADGHHEALGSVVLVYLPATEPAPRAEALRRRVARLARRAGATVVLADVLPELPGLVQRLLPDGAAVATLLRDARQHALDAHALHLRRAGVPTATLLLEGSPAVALVQEQLRGDYRLLVTGVPGPEATDEAAHAARRLARQLARKAACPVRIVRLGHDASPPPRLRRRRGTPRVVVALDAVAGGTGDTPAEQALHALAARILAEGAVQAQVAGAALHVVHAWRAIGENILRSRRLAGRYTDADIARYRAAMQDEARRALDRVLAAATTDLPVPVTGVALVDGDPADALPACVADGDVDALVVGTVARSGLAGVLIGNTADELIATAPCDVVVVKPAGFVSPIVPPGRTADAKTPRLTLL